VEATSVPQLDTGPEDGQLQRAGGNNICKEKIQDTILQNVKNARFFFSLLFDETTDISHVEQLSTSLRYFNDDIIKNLYAFGMIVIRGDTTQNN
jgi:hypothetical protein